MFVLVFLIAWFVIVPRAIALVLAPLLSLALGEGLGLAQAVLSPEAETLREDRLIEAMNRGMKQDYFGAIALFSALIDQYPDYAEAYFNRAIARTKIHDYTGAIADHSQAIRHQPDHAEAYQARAILRWQRGERETARQDLRQALEWFAHQGNGVSYQETQTLLHQWESDSP